MKIHQSLRWHSGVALSKGLILLIFGLGILAEAFCKTAIGIAAEAPAAGAFTKSQWPEQVVGLAIAAVFSEIILRGNRRGENGLA